MLNRLNQIRNKKQQESVTGILSNLEIFYCFRDLIGAACGANDQMTMF